MRAWDGRRRFFSLTPPWPEVQLPCIPPEARPPASRQCHVSRRLESPALDRVVRISAKPTKLLHEALQPVLAKHGLSLQQVELRRVSLPDGVYPGDGPMGVALMMARERAGSSWIGGSGRGPYNS